MVNEKALRTNLRRLSSQRAAKCYSARGPDADRRGKASIYSALEAHDPDLWNCPALEGLAGLVPTPSVRKEKPRTERRSLIAMLRLRSFKKW
jgi:hypothetical protein